MIFFPQFKYIFSKSIKSIFVWTFLGGADSVHCLNISEIENADNVDKETRKVDLNSETLGTTVALPSSPTHIGLNANEQTLAVCVKLNNVPHIYLYDSR